uniref:Uncharacterized protein n=1 Tax=Acrobeloides nanus TaxID=290746 RepID=A0A914CIQ3_9BILA
MAKNFVLILFIGVILMANKCVGDDKKPDNGLFTCKVPGCTSGCRTAICNSNTQCCRYWAAGRVTHASCQPLGSIYCGGK